MGGEQVDDPMGRTIAGRVPPGYKATAQGWWALGAAIGSFFGAQVAGLVGAGSLTS